jgi:hypothetical protein
MVEGGHSKGSLSCLSVARACRQSKRALGAEVAGAQAWRDRGLGTEDAVVDGAVRTVAGMSHFNSGC